MINPVKSFTITSQSQESEQNRQINDFLRSQGNRPVIPRNLTNNETLRRMFHDDDGDGDLNGD